MSLETQEDEQVGEQREKQGHQLLHVSMTQGGELSEDWSYLDGCLTVTAFKNNKFLEEIHTVLGGIKINCNAGAVVTNMKGKFGRLNGWYLPDGIANIFSMHKLDRITYNSWEGFYVVHTPRGEVHFHKDKHGLPFIDLTESGREAARMLMQLSKDAHEGGKNKGEGADALSLVQTVHENYEGYTRQEILKAKEARHAQTMLGSPNEKDLQGLVSSNMIENCPFTLTDISNPITWRCHAHWWMQTKC
jgi:hypothetical protein